MQLSIVFQLRFLVRPPTASEMALFEDINRIEHTFSIKIDLKSESKPGYTQYQEYSTVTQQYTVRNGDITLAARILAVVSNNTGVADVVLYAIRSALYSEN